MQMNRLRTEAHGTDAMGPLTCNHGILGSAASATNAIEESRGIRFEIVSPTAEQGSVHQGRSPLHSRPAVCTGRFQW